MEYTERTKAEQIANAYFDMGAGWSASGGLLKELREMEDGYIKQLADAQATVEALQARVQELEQWVQDQSTANLETMRHTDEMQSRALEAEQQLTQRTAEFQRHDGELQQICGQALGYPWFKDDQKNFPGATEKDGVCVGEHVGITIAQELANAYRKRTAELEAIEKTLDIDSGKTTVEKVRDLHHSFKQVWDSYQDASNEMFKAHAELERVRGERDAALELRDRWQAQLDKEQADSFMRNIEIVKLRGLVKALPKVEGAVVFSNGYVKDSTRCHALFGADEDAALYAALLQHRQGME